MEVREIRPDEHLATGTCTLAAYRALGGVALSGEYAAELADVARRAAEAVVFVAVEDGRVLGTVTYVPGPWSAYAESLRPGEAGIRMLAVDPSAQGRGVGRALVAACVARARADRVLRVALHTAPWMHRAHRLYEQAGFRRAPDRDWAPVPDIPLRGYVLELVGSATAVAGGDEQAAGGDERAADGRA